MMIVVGDELIIHIAIWIIIAGSFLQLIVYTKLIVKLVPNRCGVMFFDDVDVKDLVAFEKETVKLLCCWLAKLIVGLIAILCDKNAIGL